MRSIAEQVAATAQVKEKETVLEEEPVQPLKEEPQIEPVQKKQINQKNIKWKPTWEVVCKNRGKSFTSRSEKAKTCSGKCGSAYSRKKKNRKIKFVYFSM